MISVLTEEDGQVLDGMDERRERLGRDVFDDVVVVARALLADQPL
jgi:hypothetical protein